MKKTLRTLIGFAFALVISSAGAVHVINPGLERAPATQSIFNAN